MKTIRTWTQTAFAGVGGDRYPGGTDGFLYALIAFVVVDYLTGVLRAIVEKQLSGRVGSKGIAKKAAIFLIVGIGHPADAYVLGGSGVPLRTAVVLFCIANEGISLLENATAIGLPVPDKLKDVLQQLHGGGGETK